MSKFYKWDPKEISLTIAESRCWENTKQDGVDSGQKVKSIATNDK